MLYISSYHFLSAFFSFLLKSFLLSFSELVFERKSSMVKAFGQNLTENTCFVLGEEVAFAYVNVCR